MITSKYVNEAGRAGGLDPCGPLGSAILRPCDLRRLGFEIVLTIGDGTLLFRDANLV